MHTYVILIRGINVGGKNKVPMVELKTQLEALGCTDVVTYIQSGNAIVRSAFTAKALGGRIEAMLVSSFKMDSPVIKVLVLTQAQLQAVVDNRPKGFGDQPDKYYSDAIFLMGVNAKDVMPIFKPREGVDRVWPGDGVVYSERLGVERTKSRLSKIIESPLYKSMTIRSWGTTCKILELLKKQ